jgi:hypothetical protein
MLAFTVLVIEPNIVGWLNFGAGFVALDESFLMFANAGKVG